MPCLQGVINDNNRLIIKVSVKKSGLPNIFNAMIDTGAAHTCISNNVIRSLSLDICREQSVYNVHSELPTYLYSVDLIINTEKIRCFLLKLWNRFFFLMPNSR